VSFLNIVKTAFEVNNMMVEVLVEAGVIQTVPPPTQVLIQFHLPTNPDELSIVLSFLHP
jgi:hypothetical protein